MDCYSCKFRGTVPGSAHSSCSALPEDIAMPIFISLALNHPIAGLEKYIDINKHGIQNGWANYPVDFDPIWIKSCSFYEKKNEEIPIS